MPACSPASGHLCAPGRPLRRSVARYFSPKGYEVGQYRRGFRPACFGCEHVGVRGVALDARETDLVRQDLRRPNDSRIARLLTLLGLAAAGTAQDASTRLRYWREKLTPVPQLRNGGGM